MKRKTEAVTLIELMLVLVIAAILATVIYSKFESFHVRARLKDIYVTTPIIVAAERYYLAKKGNIYYFSRNGAGTKDGTAANPDDYDGAEDVLNITLPEPDAFCRYRVADIPAPFAEAGGIGVYTAAPEIDKTYDDIYLYGFIDAAEDPIDVSYRNINHDYHKYLEADNDTGW